LLVGIADPPPTFADRTPMISKDSANLDFLADHGGRFALNMSGWPAEHRVTAPSSLPPAGNIRPAGRNVQAEVGEDEGRPVRGARPAIPDMFTRTLPP